MWFLHFCNRIPDSICELTFDGALGHLSADCIANNDGGNGDDGTAAVDLSDACDFSRPRNKTSGGPVQAKVAKRRIDCSCCTKCFWMLCYFARVRQIIATKAVIEHSMVDKCKLYSSSRARPIIKSLCSANGEWWEVRLIQYEYCTRSFGDKSAREYGQKDDTRTLSAKMIREPYRHSFLFLFLLDNSMECSFWFLSLPHNLFFIRHLRP